MPQIKNRKSWNTEKYQFGVEMVERINDEAYTYISNLVTNTSDEAFLQAMIKLRGRVDNCLCRALKELLKLCVLDEKFRQINSRMI